MKKVFLFLTLISVFALNVAGFDKDVIVLDQTRNDKVKTVFREMMDAYQEGDVTKFFTFVSEDRFEQDYVTFYEAIDEDMRVYDILSIETWVNKITEDGVRRYLYVQWDKRYESTQSSSGTEINQLGLSRFLFDEVNGKYKLIELAGNNFWGGSLPEWREEVPQIAGQEEYDVQHEDGLPDLVPSCSQAYKVAIANIGTSSTQTGEIHFTITTDSSSDGYIMTRDLSAGESHESSISCPAPSGTEGYVIVNPDQMIEESDYTNNEHIIAPY